MNILRLEDNLAERLGLTESQPCVDHLMVPIHHSPDRVVVGATSQSFALDVSDARSGRSGKISQVKGPRCVMSLLPYPSLFLLRSKPISKASLFLTISTFAFLKVGMPISAGITASAPYVNENGVSPLLDLIMIEDRLYFVRAHSQSVRIYLVPWEGAFRHPKGTLFEVIYIYLQVSANMFLESLIHQALRDSAFQSISGSEKPSLGHALFKSLKSTHVLQLSSCFFTHTGFDSHCGAFPLFFCLTVKHPSRTFSLFSAMCRGTPVISAGRGTPGSETIEHSSGMILLLRNGEGDLTTMKFIQADVECSSSSIFTSNDICLRGHIISPLNPGVFAGINWFLIFRRNLLKQCSYKISEEEPPSTYMRCTQCPLILASMIMGPSIPSSSPRVGKEITDSGEKV
nr:hypothetical protein [Tanacetum cinerariifolium]